MFTTSRTDGWMNQMKQLHLFQLLNDKVHVRDVSAMDRKSLYEPFMYLASRLNPQPNKSTLAKVTSTMKRDKNRDAD